MREVENRPVKAPCSTEFLPSPSGRMSQSRGVDAMQNCLICCFQVLDVGSGLGVFLEEDGKGVVACCYEGGAGVVG